MKISREVNEKYNFLKPIEFCNLVRFGICYQYKCYENSAETNWKDEYRFFEELVDFF